MIYKSFSVLAFCIALLLMLHQVNTYHTMLKTTKNQLVDPVVLEQYNASDITIVPYGKLIAMLFHPLEYDIQINDFIIRKSEHDYSKISAYPLAPVHYKKTYSINENDTIKCIVYTSINES